MTQNKTDRFEILRLLAIAGVSGEDLNQASQDALKGAVQYVGLSAAALYLWDDDYKATVSVYYSANEENIKHLDKLEESLFTQLRKEKQLLSAYLSFGGDNPYHAFTLPLNYGKKIFGAVIGIQEGKKTIIAEDLFIEALSALLALNYAAQGIGGAGLLSEDLLNKERLSAILETAVTVNHEVNNPLTAILGNVQLLLLNRDDLDKELKAKLKIIEESALKIKDVTQRLM
ncbi:MAG: histidine kinase dimerization/phospho-acceptor domain-containing protein, partial [Candidatus Zixiibacteriota bacterium]